MAWSTLRLNSAMSPDERPSTRGATIPSRAARVASMPAWPKASPQPTSPSSVSTRTSRMSRWVQALPAKRAGGPPMSKGSDTIRDWMSTILTRSSLHRACWSARRPRRPRGESGPHREVDTRRARCAMRSSGWGYDLPRYTTQEAAQVRERRRARMNPPPSAGEGARRRRAGEGDAASGEVATILTGAIPCRRAAPLPAPADAGSTLPRRGGGFMCAGRRARTWAAFSSGSRDDLPTLSPTGHDESPPPRDAGTGFAGSREPGVPNGANGTPLARSAAVDVRGGRGVARGHLADQHARESRG